MKSLYALFLSLSLNLVLALPARAVDVPSVLSQWQQARLEQCPAIDADRGVAQRLRADFDKVLAAAPELASTPFRVSDCPVIAQVRAGVVVVSTQLAGLPEKERLFVMAHELGHVAHGDWQRVAQRYVDYVGVVQTFDEVVEKMKQVNSEINDMSRAGEFDADEFALEVLKKAGYPATEAATSFLRRYRDQPESDTHPAIRARLERVRRKD